MLEIVSFEEQFDQKFKDRSIMMLEANQFLFLDFSYNPSNYFTLTTCKFDGKLTGFGHIARTNIITFQYFLDSQQISIFTPETLVQVPAKQISKSKFIDMLRKLPDEIQHIDRRLVKSIAQYWLQ